jgi:glycerol uptake facilitator-like aquaporin
MSLARRAVAEALGSAFLLAGIVGSGIMAERVSSGNVGIALLANTLATGGVLMCLIAALGPISGGHFNPAVSLGDALRGGLPWREVPVYVGAQVAGAIAGVAAANTMFGLPLLFTSHHERSGPAQWFAELVATFGLLVIIWGCTRFRSAFTPFAVAAYIVAAYWFTSSTSFANPAVTLARSLSDTFAGIRPQDAPEFIFAELAGALGATLLFRWLAPIESHDLEPALLPHNGESHAVA